MLLTGQDSVRVRKTISRQRKNVILFADFSILKRLIRMQKIGAILSLFGLILRGIKFSEWHSCAFMLSAHWTALEILAQQTDRMTNQPTDPFTLVLSSNFSPSSAAERYRIVNYFREFSLKQANLV